MNTALGLLFLLLLLVALGGLLRKAEAANRADWGNKWLNRIDGLGRLFLRHYHHCEIEPIPLPERGPALVVSNHISGLDPLLMLAACNRPVHFLIAREQYARFGLRWLFRRAECIPVDRSSRDDSAFRAALEALRAGKVIGLFPQGRIHWPEDRPLRLKRGVARLAKLGGAPIYPARISNVRLPGHVLPAVLLPGRARLQSLPPLDCRALDEAACLAQLTEILNKSSTGPIAESDVP